GFLGDRRESGVCDRPAARELVSLQPPETLSLAAPAAVGLTTDDAVRRLRRFGPNEPASARRLLILPELARDLANPLVLVLLIASGLSAAFGQLVSATVTAAMIVLSVSLNFLQSYRSQQAARRLRELVNQTAAVTRDGRVQSVPVRNVVPDDLVHLA